MTDPEAKTERIKHEIEQTRDDLSETVAALEEKLAPAQVREVVHAELQHVEERVRDVLGDKLDQAKAVVSAELLEAKNALREGLQDAERMIRTGLSDARASVREDVKDALTGARDAVRAATLGKVETLATSLGDSMNDARDTLIDTIRANPLPAALTGVGLAWLLMNRSRSARSPRFPHTGDPWSSSGRMPQGQQLGDAVANVGDTVGRAASHVSGAVTQGVQGATDAAGNLASGASDMVSSVAHAAGEGAQRAAHTARESATAVAGTVRDGARRVEQTFERQLHDRPLAVGAAALAIGTMVGCALPRTSAEDELMGEARDTVMQRAGDVVHETAETFAGLAEHDRSEERGDQEDERDRPTA